MNNRKGVTLVELILALALLSLVITIGVNIFMIGNKAQKISATEADIQANARLVSEQINNVLRYATKTHTIPRSSFQNSENGVRDSTTSYIGVTKAGDVVIDEPGEPGQPRKITYLARNQDGVDYEIIFDKVLDAEGTKMNRVLSYSIIGKKDGIVVSEIVSKIEVLNSINVDHLGTPSDPAVAIAYSMVDPGSQEWLEMSPDAYITLVLDKSGSMDWDMDGVKTTINNNKRIKILKEKALKTIDKLASLGFNIYVSVVPFSENANNPSGFKNLKDPVQLAQVKESIGALEPSGTTNTGDGIRRAYYQLFDKAKELNNNQAPTNESLSKITQHMMILVDGETNTETRKITGRGWFFGYHVTSEHITDENGNTNNNIVVGNKRTVSVANNDSAYVNFIGDRLIQPYRYTQKDIPKQAINSFVIGFSNTPKDHNSLQSIGNSVLGKQFEHSDGTMKPYILATSSDELDFAFEQFESEVENSLWLITRPQLWP